jgi:hypothetical protein
VSSVITIWRKYGCSAGLSLYAEHSATVVVISKYAQRDIEHGALQELEAPTIVHLAWYEPLLHDAQHRRVLVRLNHRRGIPREEGTQQRDESWDGALLRPHGRREEEREEGAVVDWYAPMQGQHLGEDLEDIGYVFCDSR